MAKKLNRGMGLEKAVNKCNLLYRKGKLALIEKIELGFRISAKGPIPLQSTVDYKGMVYDPTLGVAKGIAFDAKETKNKTSFPLSNVEGHQIEYLRYVHQVSGQAYLLVHFLEVHPDQAYLTPISFVLGYWDNKETGRKSIPVTEFKAEWLVPLEDYLGLLNGKP